MLDPAIERGHFNCRAKGRLAERQRYGILEGQMGPVALEQLVRGDAEDADQIALLATRFALVPHHRRRPSHRGVDARRDLHGALALLDDPGATAARWANIRIGDDHAQPAAAAAGLLLRKAEKPRTSSTPLPLQRRHDGGFAVGLIPRPEQSGQFSSRW